jgi:hypothetical protein
MNGTRIVEIEREDIEQNSHLDLISHSLTLCLADLGYPQLSIRRLEDKDDIIRFEIQDTEQCEEIDI